MRAWLEVELPPGAWVLGADSQNRFPLEVDRRVWIGRGDGCDLTVKGLVFGGQRNCGVILRSDGQAVLFHAGHALAIEVDGTMLLPHGEPRLLQHGSTFSPEGDKPGLRFRLIVEQGP